MARFSLLRRENQKENQKENQMSSYHRVPEDVQEIIGPLPLPSQLPKIPPLKLTSSQKPPKINPSPNSSTFFPTIK